MFSIPDPELARLGIYYDYYTGEDHRFPGAMEREDAMEQIGREIAGDKKLRKEISRHARRTGAGYDEAS